MLIQLIALTVTDCLYFLLYFKFYMMVPEKAFGLTLINTEFMDLCKA